MKLQMTTNLGLIDAKRLGIGAAKEAEIIDVEESVASDLLKRGWAVSAPAAAPAVKAAPQVDIAATFKGKANGA